MDRLIVGNRVYNHGDMANDSHFGTVAQVVRDKWGTHYQIAPDPDCADRGLYWVDHCAFSDVYRGNGSTRLVAEAAYNAYRNERKAIPANQLLRW